MKGEIVFIAIGPPPDFEVGVINVEQLVKLYIDLSYLREVCQLGLVINLLRVVKTCI